LRWPNDGAKVRSLFSRLYFCTSISFDTQTGATGDA
jgi:hypothetical protein